MYDFCKVKHFAALKREGVIIKGGAIFRGSTVLDILKTLGNYNGS